MPQTRIQGWLDDAQIAELVRRAEPAMQLAISLMADAGCRLREALSFNVSSLSGDLLRIYGSKGKRWRSVPIPDRLSRAICAASVSQDLADRPAIFPFSPREFQRRILELCLFAGTPLTTAHRLRHSYATRLHAEGVPIATISALLGHKSIAVTLLYLHVGETDYALARRALNRRARRFRSRKARSARSALARS